MEGLGRIAFDVDDLGDLAVLNACIEHDFLPSQIPWVAAPGASLHQITSTAPWAPPPELASVEPPPPPRGIAPPVSTPPPAPPNGALPPVPGVVPPSTKPP